MNKLKLVQCHERQHSAVCSTMSIVDYLRPHRPHHHSSPSCPSLRRPPLTRFSHTESRACLAPSTLESLFITTSSIVRTAAAACCRALALFLSSQTEQSKTTHCPTDAGESAYTAPSLPVCSLTMMPVLVQLLHLETGVHALSNSSQRHPRRVPCGPGNVDRTHSSRCS